MLEVDPTPDNAIVDVVDAIGLEVGDAVAGDRVEPLSVVVVFSLASEVPCSVVDVVGALVSAMDVVDEPGTDPR